ncbi:U-box domain-containing protein 52-like, partial [Trifolium medium]|nr:U-box domain-containing protein 52-like [Trifolium medium]
MPMMMFRGGGAVAFNPRGSNNYFINSTSSTSE